MAKRNHDFDPNEKCKQAIIFARVSSKRQKDEGVSLDVQEKTIRQYCQNNNFKILDTISIDESSTQGNRKKFHKMLELAEECQGKVAIVVNYVDRLQRTYTDTPELERLRSSGKIEIHALRENLIITKDSPAMDLTVWYMHVLMANFQVNTMIDKVRASQKENWAEGKWQGLAPIGYLNAKDEDRKATLIIDEERAKIIQRLFEEYATGLHSLASILKFAQELGFKSKEKNYHKTSPNFNKRALVSRNTIHNILRNPFYYGMMKIKGKEMPHRYDTIISKALFDKVQEILNQKNCTGSNHEQQYKALPFTFRGIIKCSTCGCTISPEHHKVSTGEYCIYYKCSHIRGNCSQVIVRETQLLEQLDEEIFSKLNVPAALLQLIKQNVQNNLEENSKINRHVKRRLLDELKILENKEDNLTDLYCQNKIREDIYNRQIVDIANERTRITETIEKYKDIGKDIKESIDKVLDVAGSISHIMKTADPKTKNKMLKLLISDCKLSGDKLIYTINKPFDKFISAPSPKLWTTITMNNLEEFGEGWHERELI